MAEMKKMPDGSLIMIAPPKPKPIEAKPGFMAGFKAAIGLGPAAPPHPAPAPIVPSWMAPPAPAPMPNYAAWAEIEKQQRIKDAMAQAAPKK